MLVMIMTMISSLKHVSADRLTKVLESQLSPFNIVFDILRLEPAPQLVKPPWVHKPMQSDIGHHVVPAQSAFPPLQCCTAELPAYMHDSNVDSNMYIKVSTVIRQHVWDICHAACLQTQAVL